jgi:hypothetical protein
MSNLEKKSFTSDEIKDFVQSWRISGMSKKQFSDQHGLKYYTFIAWCDKYGKAEKGPGFEQIQLSGTEKVFMEVVTRERTLRFYQPIPKEYLSLLLQ